MRYVEHAWTNTLDQETGCAEFGIAGSPRLDVLRGGLQASSHQATWLFMQSDGATKDRLHAKVRMAHCDRSRFRRFGRHDLPVDFSFLTVLDPASVSRMNAVGSPRTEESLLTIKEAAAALRVSEVSLRRWTDQGVLPCLRVGGRRERRFRVTDIQALARRDPAHPDEVRPGRASGSLQGLDIARGEHLCALYDSENGRDKLAVPFLRDGLAGRDRCFLVAANSVRDAILERLVTAGIEVAERVAEGTLVCHAPGAEPARTLAFFRSAFSAATTAGCAGMRVLGDMAAFADAGAPLDALVAFEAEFDQALAHKYPVVSLCQYDARVFSGVAILRALEIHGDIHRHPLRYFLGA